MHTQASTRAHTRVRTPFELHTTRAGVHICHCLQIKLGAMGAFNEDEEEAASEKPGRSGLANARDDVDAHLDSLKDMSPSKRAAQLHEVCRSAWPAVAALWTEYSRIPFGLGGV